MPVGRLAPRVDRELTTVGIDVVDDDVDRHRDPGRAGQIVDRDRRRGDVDGFHPQVDSAGVLLAGVVGDRVGEAEQARHRIGGNDVDRAIVDDVDFDAAELAHIDDANRVTVRVAVVAECLDAHPNTCRRGGAIVAGHGGPVGGARLDHAHQHPGLGLLAIAVGHPIGELIVAEEVGVRFVSERTVGADGRRAVFGLAESDHRQRVALRVGVVVEYRYVGRDTDGRLHPIVVEFGRGVATRPDDFDADGRRRREAPQVDDRVVEGHEPVGGRRRRCVGHSRAVERDRRAVLGRDGVDLGDRQRIVFGVDVVGEGIDSDRAADSGDHVVIVRSRGVVHAVVVELGRVGRVVGEHPGHVSALVDPPDSLGGVAVGTDDDRSFGELVEHDVRAAVDAEREW